MSTVAWDNKTNDGVYVYTKGSPEKMIKMKIFDSKTVPNDYELILRKYASMGFRVLAVGHRQVLKETDCG